jgi:diadenosine tetraphosphate (Ap4A) HIT family hydrolase
MRNCCDIFTKFETELGTYAENEHWLVAVRPKQVTLGASVLMLKRHAQGLAELTPAELIAFGEIVQTLEAKLGSAFAYEKVNYLMLMMADSHLHFHVIPRYGAPKLHGGLEWEDAGWPKAPEMAKTHSDAGAASIVRNTLQTQNYPAS